MYVSEFRYIHKGYIAKALANTLVFSQAINKKLHAHRMALFLIIPMWVQGESNPSLHTDQYYRQAKICMCLLPMLYACPTNFHFQARLFGVFLFFIYTPYDDHSGRLYFQILYRNVGIVCLGRWWCLALGRFSDR